MTRDLIGFALFPGVARAGIGFDGVGFGGN